MVVVVVLGLSTLNEALVVAAARRRGFSLGVSRSLFWSSLSSMLLNPSLGSAPSPSVGS
jgi:hypothetical protein